MRAVHRWNLCAAAEAHSHSLPPVVFLCGKVVHLCRSSVSLQRVIQSFCPFLVSYMKYNSAFALPLFAALFMCIGLFSCSSGWSEEDERFVRTYTDILIVRELTSDTTVANPQVRKIVAENGYTWESFRAQYMQYTAKAEQFRTMLDSARNRALRAANEKKQREATQ